MKDIKMMAAVMAATIGAFGAYAAGGGTTVSLTPLNLASQGETSTATQPAAAESDTVKVKGRGVGVNKTEALKDAYRDAIARAGLYVDAETAADNDQIVKDQILTHSNAYITDYRELGEEKLDSGLVQLRILATVQKRALTNKLSGVMPTQTFQLGNEGAQTHANHVTQGKRVEDAAALLENAIKDINPITQLIRMSLADTRMLRKEVVEAAKGLGTKESCFYKFKFELDTQKYYREFLPPLLNVLDQIALAEPKTVRFSGVFNGTTGGSKRSRDFAAAGGRSSRSGGGDDNSMYLAGEWDCMYEGRPAIREEGHRSYRSMRINSAEQVLAMVHCDVVMLRGTKDEWSLSMHENDTSWQAWSGRNCWMDREINDKDRQWAMREADQFINKDDGFQVVVITEMNDSRTIAKGKYYRLPMECARTIIDWQAKLLGEVFNLHMEEAVGTHYNIVFKDADGSGIYSQPCEIKNALLTNTMVGCGPMFTLGQKRQGGCMVGYGWYVTPMIHTDAQSLQGWIGFDIPLDDLPKIRAVTIELADEPIHNHRPPFVGRR